MTLLSTALVTTSALRLLVQQGLGALVAADRGLIAVGERPKVGDSIDFDSATRPEFPQSHRWDYLMSVPAAAQIVGLEPHTAKDSEINVVIAKKQNAQAYLRGHLHAKHRVAKWIWVTHGTVGFSKMERARRLLDQSGIAFEGRLLRSL